DVEAGIIKGRDFIARSATGNEHSMISPPTGPREKIDQSLWHAAEIPRRFSGGVTHGPKFGLRAVVASSHESGKPAGFTTQAAKVTKKFPWRHPSNPLRFRCQRPPAETRKFIATASGTGHW